MNILELATEQIEKENKLYNKNVSLLILDRMTIIRKWLDIQARNMKVAINREANKRRVKNG